MTHVTPKQPTLRERRGSRSLEEVAEKIGVSARSLRRWEDGDVVPDAENLIKLAEAYRIHPRKLMASLPEPVAKG